MTAFEKFTEGLSKARLRIIFDAPGCRVLADTRTSRVELVKIGNDAGSTLCFLERSKLQNGFDLWLVEETSLSIPLIIGQLVDTLPSTESVQDVLARRHAKMIAND